MNAFSFELLVVFFCVTFCHEILQLLWGLVDIPIPSMYGRFTYMSHKNRQKLGKYTTIHGWYGIYYHFPTIQKSQVEGQLSHQVPYTFIKKARRGGPLPTQGDVQRVYR